MRILILTPRPPWPAVDGGRVAMSSLAESLAENGAEVEVLSLDPRKHRRTDVTAGAPVPMQTIDIDTSRIVRPALRSLGHQRPYIVERFVSSDFENALCQALHRFEPDVVQIESPFLIPYAGIVRAESSTQIVLRSQNVEFRIWESLARHEPRFFKKVALRRAASSLRRFEVRHLDTVDAIVPISAADGEDYRRLGCTRPIHVAPCGVSLSDLSSRPSLPGTVGFIGSLDFRPNQQAVEWILDELWPRVLQRNDQAQLSIAGNSPPEWLLRRDLGRNIVLRGHVEDAAEFMGGMSVMIAPLFAGGGMRIKVLEAMALGKAVVATRLGAGGIEVEPGRDILKAEDAESFAEAVASLLSDRERAAGIGTAARATIAARYDKAVIGRALLRFYESLDSNKARAPRIRASVVSS